MEQFSLETQSEFKEWKESIERVLGIGGVEELLSEDEEEMEASPMEPAGMVCACASLA